MFETANDYHEINAGAHRKPPKILSAPALIWHLAFWTGGGQSDDVDNSVKARLDALILALGKLIEARFGKVELLPCIAGKRLLFETTCHDGSFDPVSIPLTPRQTDIFTSISRAVSLHFKWYGLDVTIRFEMHTEYAAVTTFVELDQDRSGNPFSTDDELNEGMHGILRYLCHPPPPAAIDQQAGEINALFFYDFWTRFERDLDFPSLRTELDDGIFQNIFADVRGFIASDHAVQFRDDRFFEQGEPPTWGEAAKKILLPLIQRRDRATRTRYECAANYLIDGRALYLSTLGPQIPSKPEGVRIPVEFIVYAHQGRDGTTIVNRWQLGRAISQILLIETLRLCSLRHLKLLHAAGRELAQLDEITQQARDAVASAGSRTPSDLAFAEHSKTMAELIDLAHQRLNHITREFLDQSKSGLLYRIERSRYYVNQFEQNIKLLRIRRLEGNQPYDQFIRRRLGSEFDFIDRLGRRYERGTNTMLSLDQSYLAITQNRLVEKTARIDEEAKTIQAGIHTIQEWGELILLAVLMPYYISHLAAMILGEHELYIRSLTALIWSVSAVVAWFRWRWKSQAFWEVLPLMALVGSLLIGASAVWFAVDLRSHFSDRVNRQGTPSSGPSATPMQPPATH